MVKYIILYYINILSFVSFSNDTIRVNLPTSFSVDNRVVLSDSIMLSDSSFYAIYDKEYEQCSIGMIEQRKKIGYWYTVYKDDSSKKMVDFYMSESVISFEVINDSIVNSIIWKEYQNFEQQDGFDGIFFDEKYLMKFFYLGSENKLKLIDIALKIKNNEIILSTILHDLETLNFNYLISIPLRPARQDVNN